MFSLDALYWLRKAGGVSSTTIPCTHCFIRKALDKQQLDQSVKHVATTPYSCYVKFEQYLPLHKLLLSFHILHTKCWQFTITYASRCTMLVVTLLTRKVCEKWTKRRQTMRCGIPLAIARNAFTALVHFGQLASLISACPLEFEAVQSLEKRPL